MRNSRAILQGGSVSFAKATRSVYSGRYCARHLSYAAYGVQGVPQKCTLDTQMTF
jgi:hypothetical protein